MSIEAGVQFLLAKAPVCKDFHIPFNESRLCSYSETSAAEPVSILVGKPFKLKVWKVCIWLTE